MPNIPGLNYNTGVCVNVSESSHSERDCVKYIVKNQEVNYFFFPLIPVGFQVQFSIAFIEAILSDFIQFPFTFSLTLARSPTRYKNAQYIQVLKFIV